ncbi:MAG: class I adenylate-forming enzyme family protein [Armatimonadota bacterium]
MTTLYEEILLPSVKKYPRSTAVVSHDEGDVELTFQKLKESADAFALGLEAVGVRLGSRVAVVAPNSIGLVSALFGIWKLGAAAVLVAPMLRPPEIARLMSDCMPQIILVSHLLASEFADALSSICPNVPTVVFRMASLAAKPGLAANEPDGLTPEGAAAILYTSGTTGFPKGVVLTTENFASNTRSAAQILDVLDIPQDDKVFSAVLPFFHSFGLTTCLLLPVAVGAKSVLFSTFNPRVLLAGAAKHRISFLLLVPEMYRGLTTSAAASWNQAVTSPPIPSLRACISGGSPLAWSVAVEFEKVFGMPIHQGYGVTETSPVLSLSDLHSPPVPGCSGRAIPGVELVVLDENLEEVPSGTDGELAAAGPNVAWGYFRNPELTKSRFRVLALSGREPRRCYLTGDLACLDGEGRVFIRGRKDDLILVNGLNVYPAEIANALMQFPKCADVAVGRIRCEKHGQEPVALMVLREGESATEDEVKSFAVGLLAPHKVPGRIIFVPEIKKSTLQKPMVKEMLLKLGFPAF